MSDRKDLTRWNRAGLSRFTYVDGNAVEYLELLRQQLAVKFEDANWLIPSVPVPVNEEQGENETLLDKQKRLHLREQRILKMYHQDRRDWAWEITRTFARACYILTGYADAWANEGYLGTATQWDNVRRLVGLLDYYPAPPASATTTLVFEAKKAGKVAKGFQVKNSPLMGTEKVIFETLEDVDVDPALNALRPKGWDKSDEPVVLQENNNGNSNSSTEDQQFSSVANGSIINLQGVGKGWFNLLNPDGESSVRVPKIKDFLDLDPEDGSDVIGTNRLKEFKTKAITICNFELEDDWSAITDRFLPDIATENLASLAGITGNSLSKVEALQFKIDQIGTYLDLEVFQGTKLKDLLAPTQSREAFSEPDSVATSWKALQNPKVIPGQVAMICHMHGDGGEDEYVDEAEAATIAGIEKTTSLIHLIPASLPNKWTSWSKGQTRLRVAPRWKRQCWLNGNDVIRTVEPHGLSAESFVSWKINYSLQMVSVANVADLVAEGQSMIIVALVSDQLHIRIFNQSGEMVVDKAENDLPREESIRDLKELSFPLPGEDLDLAAGDQQNIIETAILCAGYTQWRYAKVAEVDKRNLRIKTTGPLPQEGVTLYELMPIEGSVLPAGYEVIVLAGGEDDTPPGVVSVTPSIEKPLGPDDPTPIFTVKNALPVEIPQADEGGGGGLLPPASLPEIGCFLFPSPMLPLDLVKIAVDLMLSLGVMAIPSTGEIVIKGLPFSGLLEGAEDEAAGADKLFKMLDSLVGANQECDQDGNPLWVLPNGSSTTSNDDGTLPPLQSANEKMVVWRDTLASGEPDIPAIKEALTNMLTMPEGEEATVLFQKLTEDIIDKGPLLAIPPKPNPKAVVQASNPLYMFNGSSEIGVGDWVVSEFSGGLRALKVSSINWFTDSDKTETFSLGFEKLDDKKELKKVYADFRGELIAEGADVNIDEIHSEKLELEEVPESLTPGRKVLMMAEGKEPIVAKVVDVEGTTVTTDPSASGFTKSNLIICANVVEAGHGEVKPAKILGSGNAAKSNQVFTLKVEGVSFVPDETMRSGVAAAIEVEVDGRIWKQVSTLRDSVPDDHHYAIQMTEEGYLRIHFGDGQNGRRLPSGKNNIRIRYRVGSGLAGNVTAHSLEKPVNKHFMIGAVLQPVQAAGGGDMEDIWSLRENAPSTLLALERAVSISDFADLATGRSNIWQAKARREVIHSGQMERVRVTVVPADGVSSDPMIDDVRKFLQAHALPGVQVLVVPFDPDTDFKLHITIRVKSSEFLWTDVAKEVRVALEDRFSLKRSKLGGAIYLSEVYKVVEGVKGVETSICVLEREGLTNPQVVRPEDGIKAEDAIKVLYLDSSKLTIEYEEYRP